MPQLQLNVPVPINMMMGNTGNMSMMKEITSTLNSGSSVMFSHDNPLHQGFQAVQSILGHIDQGARQIQKTIGMVLQGKPVNHFTPIVDEEQLYNVPDCMKMPILMYEPVRQLWIQGKLQAWGLSPTSLPYGEPDPWTRLINNGTVNIMPGEKIPEYFEWKFTSDDPEYEIEDLNALIETRGFVDWWLKKELSSENPRDFTNDMELMF